MHKYLIVRLLTLIYYCKRLKISVFWPSSNFEHFALPRPREARTDPKRLSVGAEQWAGSIGKAAQWLDSVVSTRCGVLWCSYDLYTASVWRNDSMLWCGVVSASVSHIPTRMHGGIDRKALRHCSIASLFLFTKWTVFHVEQWATAPLIRCFCSQNEQNRCSMGKRRYESMGQWRKGAARQR